MTETLNSNQSNNSETGVQYVSSVHVSWILSKLYLNFDVLTTSKEACSEAHCKSRV